MSWSTLDEDLAKFRRRLVAIQERFDAAEAWTEDRQRTPDELAARIRALGGIERSAGYMRDHYRRLYGPGRRILPPEEMAKLTALHRQVSATLHCEVQAWMDSARRPAEDAPAVRCLPVLFRRGLRASSAGPGCLTAS